MGQSRRTVARNWNSWGWRESSRWRSSSESDGSPGSAVLTGESSSGRPSFQVNVSGISRPRTWTSASENRVGALLLVTMALLTTEREFFHLCQGLFYLATVE